MIEVQPSTLNFKAEGFLRQKLKRLETADYLDSKIDSLKQANRMVSSFR